MEDTTSLPTAMDMRTMVQLKLRYGYGGNPKVAMAKTLMTKSKE
jgi:hypothetical protein